MAERNKVFCKKSDMYDTIVDLLQHACNEYKDSALFVWESEEGEKVVTFSRFWSDLLLMANILSQMGENNIGIICDNTYECYLAIYASMVAGKVAVPIEANLERETLLMRIKQADIGILLYHQNKPDTESLPVKNYDSRILFQEADRSGEFKWRNWPAELPAAIVFTSGTGGDKAAVVLSQQNIASINSLSDAGHVFSRGKKTIMFLPLYHAFALSIATVCIDSGCEMHLSKSIKYLTKEMQSVGPDFLITVAMVNNFFIKGINQTIDKADLRKQFQILTGISNFLRKIHIDLRHIFFRKIRQGLGGNLSVIISGGAAVPVEQVRFFDNLGICLLQGYGMTESTCAISMNTVSCNRFGSVGVVFPFNEVRIIDGEIQVKGKNIMSGYYKNPEATCDIMDGEWLKTGDLGYLTDDGFLYITGRKKNLIITSNGENVSPEELEDKLMKCEFIRETLVSEKDGHIHAEIFADYEKGMEREELIREIENYIQNMNRMDSVYKRIVSWELRDEPFDKTSTMKIRRV